MKDFILCRVKQINDNEIDIVVEDGRITQILEGGTGHHQHIIDGSDMYVSSGWIDMHVHAFAEFEPYGDEIDEIGVKQGVTTIVDAGSCGADQIAMLFTKAEQAKTNVLAFLNISRIGLKRVDELSNLEWLDKAKMLQAVQQYKNKIVGLKARISRSVVEDNGIEPLRKARAFSAETSLPLMVHIGSGPPSIEEIMPLLEQKDIVTHYLNGKANNLFDVEGNPLSVLREAIARGVHLDVGHGNASFSFAIAEAAKQHHIEFNTISTDIYRKNRLHGPVYSLSHVLSKFLYLGYSLEEVINAVTVNAANWLEKPALGRIQVGDMANLTLFKIVDEPITFMDSLGEQRSANQQIKAKGVVINGEYMEC
ncbi:amidohydrolase/deacetylase family metallohydrolase [Lysinibacillus piscis]|uniref:Dihydroorotase n=1 Tax=Lysinibacillus piscis TaxID=2518931 RepID=A0ABQ5NGA8_9BACI|nr:amidohydrolase/deacetylase family metallohydrolase [Lysinibacillus sp. KH24]GLC87305.1 dihydroorotase [Lysinibacillus sp. KH24]